MKRMFIKLLRRIYYNIHYFIFDRKVLYFFAHKSQLPFESTSFLQQIQIRNISQQQDIHLIHNVGDFIGDGKIRKRMAKGDICFIALFENRPIHFSWVSFRRAYVSEIRRAFHLKDNQAYIYHCFTSEPFRGKGVYPFVLAHIVDFLKSKETREIFIATVLNNQSSQTGICKAGFQMVSRINYTRILGFKSYNEELIDTSLESFMGQPAK